MIEIKMPKEREEVKGDLISRQAVIYYIKPYIQEIITESGVDKNEHTNRMLRAIINGIETMPTGKQQLCEDAISRQAVMGCIDEYSQMIIRPIELMECIYKLPPVTPQQKIGYWTKQEDGTYKCSNCEKYELWEGIYCASCGARMTELESS